MTVVGVIGDDHILADGKGRDRATNRLDVTNGLESKSPGNIVSASVAMVEVHIGATDGRAGNANNGIGLVNDGGTATSITDTLLTWPAQATNRMVAAAIVALGDISVRKAD